jgi:molybdopterin-guanine dinucleotide biosynthesis protein
MTPAHENPFRVDRLHALAFEPQGATWPELMERLHRLRYRAAIVGPHGSGKTTLLEALAPRLAELGYSPRLLFRNREGRGRLPRHWADALASVGASDVLLVDGYGHLGVLQRLRLRVTARRCAGLIVTAHRRRTLPTLIRTRTDTALFRRLAGQLHDSVEPRRLDALFHRHRGNLRDALRELYDLHALA